MDPIYIQLTDDTRLCIHLVNNRLMISKEQYVKIHHGDYNIEEGWDDALGAVFIPLDKLSEVAQQINRIEKLLVLK